MVIPGNGGLDIVIQRVYRSLAGVPGVIDASYLKPGARGTNGVGWDVHFGRIYPNDRIELNNLRGHVCRTTNVASFENPILELPDGTRKILVDADISETDYDLITKDRWVARCNRGAAQGLTVYSPEGYEYIFDHLQNAVYSVTKITDPNGNWMTIDYHASSFAHQTASLKEINTSDGRHVNFVYGQSSAANSVLKQVLFGQVIGGVNKSISYHYEDLPGHIPTYSFLKRVVHSGETLWQYDYHNTDSLPGGRSVSKVTSRAGVITEYDYDTSLFDGGLFLPTTVVKEKRVSGSVTAGTWTYTYNPYSFTPPSYQGFPNNFEFDETKIVTPTGCERYIHVGSQGVARSSNAVSENVARVGTLLSKSIYRDSRCSELKQKDEYTWGLQHISAQNEVQRRGLIIAKETKTPVLLEKSILRPSGTYVTEYSNYDKYGNPGTIVETGEDTRTTNITYHIDKNKWIVNRKKDETISGVGSITRTFDANGNLESENSFGTKTEYTYHRSGDIKTVKDAEGNTSTYLDYKRGIPELENLPENTVITRKVDGWGNILEATDARGKKTTYSYDTLDRIVAINTPKAADDNIAISWIDGSNGTTRTLSRGSFSELRSLDGYGKTKSVAVEGVTTTYGYDAKGRQIFVSNPNGGATGRRLTYDVLDRVLKITNPDNTTQNYSYQSGNLVRVQNERGFITNYFYRSYGDPDEKLLMRIEAPENVITDISRNKLGQPESITQGGITRSYGYDAHFFLTSETHPETGITTLGRDLVGNLISKKVGNSGVATFSYDGLNRLVATNFPGNTPDTTITYDANSNISQSTKGDVIWDYLYDDNGNLSSEKLTLQDISTSFQVLYGYNSKDSLANITYPSGLHIDYDPNDLAQPTKISGFVSGLTYHPNGQVKTIAMENGVTTTIGQHRTRLFPNSLTASGARTITNFGYSYDAGGNITNINSATHGSRSFQYDGLSRLSDTVQCAGAPIGSDPSVCFSTINYTADGNISFKNTHGLILNYSYDAQNRLQAITGGKDYSFTYDAYGNVSGNGFHSFVYGDDQNLKQVSGSNTISYQYDANNNRYLTDKDGLISISFYNQAGLLLSDIEPDIGRSSDYIYLKSQLVAKRLFCDESLDSDNDGMSNCFEEKFGFDSSDPSDASDDADSDGLTNLTEFQLSTDPLKEDSDGDKIPDGYEVAAGLDPTLGDGNLDADFDGFTNLQEFEGDSDPNDPNSIPNGAAISIANVGVSSGGDFVSLDFRAPVVAPDGTFYVSSGEGRLYAFNPDNTQKWVYSTDLNCHGSVSIGSDGVIYAGCLDGRLHAVNPDGSGKWTYASGGYVAIGPNNQIYLSTKNGTGGAIHSISPQGNLDWDYPTGSMQGNPVVAEDGTVYSYNSGLLSRERDEEEINIIDSLSGQIATGPNIHAINSNGSTKWVSSINGRTVSSPTIGIDGTIYITVDTEPYKLIALNVDGTLQRETVLADCLQDQVTNYPVSPVIGYQGEIYLHMFETQAYRPDGSIKWKAEDGCERPNYEGALSGSITVAKDGRLYVPYGTGIGRISKSGVLQWSKDIFDPFAGPAGQIISSLVIKQDGSLYGLSSNGMLYYISNNKAEGEAAETAWPVFGQNYRQTHHRTPCASDDIDNDGMVDCYEKIVGHDLNNNQDAFADSDSDGLTNLVEFQNRTHPHNADSDGDYMNDQFEISYGLNAKSHDTYKDTDSDGANNLVEYILGTDPASSNSTPAAGTPLWSVQLPGAIKAPALLSIEGKIVVSSENPGYPYDLSRTVNPLGQLERTFSACCKPEFALSQSLDGTIPGVTYDGSQLQYFDIFGTASPLFSYIPFTSPLSIVEDSSYDRGKYLVATSDGISHQVKYLYGNTIWNFDADDVVETALAISKEGNIYFGSNDHNVYAIDKNAQELWRYGTGGPVQSHPAISHEGYVYIGSDDGHLYALNSDGTLRWSYATGAPIKTSPVLAEDGTIFIGSTNGNFYAIQPDGSLLWNYSAGASINASAVVGKNGVVYVGADNGYVYALSTNGSLVWAYNVGSAIGKASPILDESGVLYVGTVSGRLEAIYTGSGGLADSAWPVYGHDPRHTGNASSGLDMSNEAPQLTISGPTQTAFTEGQSITFSGTAIDAEDGDLSAFIEWESDLDGVIGTGTSVSSDMLSLGSHVITAKVLDSDAATAIQSINLSIQSDILVTLQASVESPQLVGQQVDFTASLQGSNDTYEYLFRVKGPSTNDAWVVLQSYSAQNTFSWNTNSYLGKNKVQVLARKLGTTDAPVKSRMRLWVNDINPAESVTFATSVASPQVTGEVIAVTALATGQDEGPFEYRFEIKAPTMGNGWTLIQDFTSNATINWDTSGYFGKNRIRVSARKANSLDLPVKKKMAFWVNQPNPAQSVSLAVTPAGTQALGNQLSLVAAASGGSDSYEYEFQVRGPETNEKWLTLQAFSSQATASWDTSVVSAVGTYDFRVKARNATTADKPVQKKVKNYKLTSN